MAHQNSGNGVWPVMLTPFTESKEVDWDGLAALTEWYLASGVQGLFAVCLSSEMYDLKDDERLKVAEHVADVVDARVPIFASGTFGGGPVCAIPSLRALGYVVHSSDHYWLWRLLLGPRMPLMRSR